MYYWRQNVFMGEFSKFQGDTTASYLTYKFSQEVSEQFGENYTVRPKGSDGSLRFIKIIKPLFSIFFLLLKFQQP